MPVAKLGISFPAELIEEIDRISKVLKKNRSEVIRETITKMISDYKKKQAIEKAERIYMEIADDDKRLSEDFLSICAEPVAAYRAGRKAKKK